VDHVNIQDSNHLVEPIPDTQYNNVLPTDLTEDGPADLQVVESLPESHVEPMIEITTITYLMIQQLAMRSTQWQMGHCHNCG